jgi:hypothetical protein
MKRGAIFLDRQQWLHESGRINDDDLDNALKAPRKEKP